MKFIESSSSFKLQTSVQLHQCQLTIPITWLRFDTFTTAIRPFTLTVHTLMFTPNILNFFSHPPLSLP
jgi:hypothetical protein